MSYTSYSYLLIFLGIVFLCYTVFPKKYKWTVLLIASYAFYWISSRMLIFWLVLTTLAVYGAGLFLNRLNDTFALAKKGLEKEDKKRLKAMLNAQKKTVLAVTLLFSFGILLVLKYGGFFADTANGIAGFLHIRHHFPHFKFLLPLGISYYTLQAAGYLIDVYRGKYRASENFGKVALFLSFFPQIVEGPIGRFDLISESLFAGHSFQYDNAAWAVQRILWGLFKKMVIADRANIFVAAVFGESEYYAGSIILLAGVLYTLQIYAEFSGCMDIVIGSGQLFGVTMSENFARPFFSKSVNEFWRRWHITLGAWLKEYLFYPLSLSKPFMRLSRFTKAHFSEYFGSLVPASCALFVTWSVIGFWHGAGFKYIFYGLYYYFLMMLGMYAEPLLAKAFSALRINRDAGSLNVLRVVRTLVLVVGGMMLFRADSVGQWVRMIGRIFTSFGAGGFAKTALSCGMDRQDFWVLAVGALVMLVIGILQEKGVKIRESIAGRRLPVRWAAYACLIMAVIIFGAYGTGYDAVDFIYGQF